MQSWWLENAEHSLSEMQSIVMAQSEKSKAAFLRKAGWVWMFARRHRKWVKRWAVFDSRFGQYTFTHTPGQRHSKERHKTPRQIAGVSGLNSVLVNGDRKMYALTVDYARGRSSTICCATISQREAWVESLTTCLSEESTLDSRYDVHWQASIGSGSYAEVVLATDRCTGESVAVKMVTQAACRKHFELMDKEVQIMSMIGSHPYLLGLRDAFYSEDHIFIVTDLLEGGDLRREGCGHSKSGPPYSEDQARCILKQVLIALDRLHTLGVSHCDLKPENVLFTAREGGIGNVKLIDYNSATFFKEPTEPGGTPEFMAPELLNIQSAPNNAGWDSALDMWSVGILLFWMLAGKTPFQADTLPEVLQNVQTGQMGWPCEVDMSQDCKDLILSLLQKDPQLRPSAQQVLEHSWMMRPPKLQPLLEIMANTRALPVSLIHGIPEQPVSTGLNTATLAAMNASTPKHLCIRVPRHEKTIRYGFAASSVPALVEGAGLEQMSLRPADSVLTLDSFDDDSAPGSRDPMDSCMSLHRDLSFRQSDSQLSLARGSVESVHDAHDSRPEPSLHTRQSA